MKIKLIIILSAILSIPGGFVHAAATCRSGAGGYCVQLAAVIPGLEFIQYSGNNFGDLISSIYIFALGLVGISAFIIFVYSAFKYMTAGENETKVKDARKKMGDAVLGLILAFLSWLILKTINPDLVTTFDFNMPKLSAPAAAPVGNPAPAQSATDVANKLPGSVDLGRACANTAQCMTGLECGGGFCLDTNRVKTSPAGLGQGELCDATGAVAAKCAPPLRCKRINPLNLETRCY